MADRVQDDPVGPTTVRVGRSGVSRLALVALAAVFLAAAAGIALVRFRCSPWYPRFNDVNSDLYVYQAVGNAWTHGLLPYRDVYDVKGPFLYLLFGLFARLRPWSMGPPLAVLVGLAFVSLWLAYAIARLHLRRRPVAGLAAVLSCLLIYLSPVDVPSSFTCEELAVPGVLLLLWLTSRWLAGDPVRAAWWVLDGAVLGALFWTKYQVQAPWEAVLVGLTVVLVRGHLSARSLGRVVLLHLVGLAVVTAVILAVFSPVLPDLLQAYFLARARGLELDHELRAQGEFAVMILTHNPAVAVVLIGVLVLVVGRAVRGGDPAALTLAVAYALSLWASVAFIRHANHVFVPLAFCAVAVPQVLGALQRSRAAVWLSATVAAAAVAAACVTPLAQSVGTYGLLQSHQQVTCYQLPGRERSTHRSNVSTVFARMAGNRPIMSVGTLFAARSSYVSQLPMRHRFEFVDTTWATTVGADHVQTRYLEQRTLAYVWIHVSGLDRSRDLESQIMGATYTEGVSQPALAAALVHNYVPVLSCNNEILLRAR